jgi:hypothetical protein
MQSMMPWYVYIYNPKRHFPYLALHHLPCDFPATLWIFAVAVMHSKLRYLLFCSKDFSLCVIICISIIFLYLEKVGSTISCYHVALSRDEILEHPTIHIIRNVQLRINWLNLALLCFFYFNPSTKLAARDGPDSFVMVI